MTVELGEDLSTGVVVRSSTLGSNRGEGILTVVVELNLAMLWSFHWATVAITDHHTEAGRFLLHPAREERPGVRARQDGRRG